MTELYYTALGNIYRSRQAFCRFITANDVNLTSHQAGFYVPKKAASLLFSKLGTKGENLHRTARIRWQDDFYTDSHFIYYGQGSRNEYRITNFGKNFPFLEADYVGSLLVICQMEDDYYYGFVLEREEDIDAFMTEFNLPVDKTNHIISKDIVETPAKKLKRSIDEIVSNCEVFPGTELMSQYARNAFNSCNHINEATVLSDPDKYLLKWIDTEYSLFHSFEEKFYNPILSTQFDNSEALIDFSNKILNRRKSRAGKSLEHHLSNIFTSAQLRFEEQVVTEDNKKPDFIFPGGKEYHDFSFPTDNLVFLGAKTSCKDRWRQVLNEANRIDTKYLFTLQKGVSTNQLKEMKHERLILVVPAEIKTCFDPAYQDDIFTLSKFIGMVREKQMYI